MTDETIVAVFDHESNAVAAVSALQAAGINPSDIERHASAAAASRTPSTGNIESGKEGSFWSRLFGGQTDETHNVVYDRTAQAGGDVVTVRLQDAQKDGDHVMSILEKHDPIDVRERAATYGLVQTTATSAAAPATRASAAGDQVIQLAEEELAVGKRTIDQGKTRLRRFVSSRAVEENVTLRDETVSIQRRPVSAGSTVAADAFTEKLVEMQESTEEAVVAKTAHVTEEVVIHKGVNERVETVHENLRREEVEVTKTPAVVAEESQVRMPSRPLK